MKFEIKLWVKDKKTQEIIKLEKIDDLEIQWKGKWGKAEKKVKFAKEGKVYWILVRVELEKYLFGMRDTKEKHAFFSLAPNYYEVYQGYKSEPNNSPEKDRERQEVLKIVNPWKVGRIVFFLLIFVIIVAAILIIKKLLRKKIN